MKFFPSFAITSRVLDHDVTSSFIFGDIKAERIQSLIETIDKTVKHLKGEKSMKDQDMY